MDGWEALGVERTEKISSKIFLRLLPSLLCLKNDLMFRLSFYFYFLCLLSISLLSSFLNV